MWEGLIKKEQQCFLVLLILLFLLILYRAFTLPQGIIIIIVLYMLVPHF